MRTKILLIAALAAGCGKATPATVPASPATADRTAPPLTEPTAKTVAVAPGQEPVAAITSGAAYMREPDGVTATVRGRRGRASYREHSATTDGTVEPFVVVTLSDGKDVQLFFRDVPKAACEAWLARSKPGDTLTVRGVLNRGDGYFPPAMAECQLVGDAFK